MTTTRSMTLSPLQQLAMGIAGLLGVGRFPIASGTVGSALGVGLYLLLPLDPAIQAVAVALAFGVGVWSSGIAVAVTGETDPSVVVIDELIGMWIACWMLPKAPLPLLAAFLLFRLFDIGKWFPMKQLERLPGGWGIVADDVAAGLLARLVLLVAGLVR